MASIYAISSFYAVQLIRCIDNLLVRFNIINDNFITKFEIKDSCSVCSNNTCKRHKLLSHSTKIKVPKDFDHALEQVITIVNKKTIIFCNLHILHLFSIYLSLQNVIYTIIYLFIFHLYTLITNIKTC